MTEQRGGENEKITAQVKEGLGEAREFAKSLDMDQVKSGEWFARLLKRVQRTYDKNARAEYLQKKYPGLPPDEIADILISITTRYSMVAGGVSGAATSAALLTTGASAGTSSAATVPVFLSAVGTEAVYLSYLQMRLVLDLSVVYKLELDPDDPEDILMVFGYALGVAPAEAVGQAASAASQKVLGALSGKLAQRQLLSTFVKSATPVASAAIGGGYNYVTTRSVGGIAKAHFRNRRKFTQELQNLISRKNTYDLVFPAVAMYVANLDGELAPKEREFYKAMLSRMSFDDHTPEDFQRLLDSGEDLMETAAEIEDPEMKRSLMEVIVLMAVCDGELADAEREFLTRISERLEMPLDMAEVERGTEEYRVVVKQNILGRAASGVGGAASVVGGKAALFGGKVRGRLGSGRLGSFGRRKAEEADILLCPACLEEISASHKFCPECGQPATTVGEPVT